MLFKILTLIVSFLEIWSYKMPFHKKWNKRLNIFIPHHYHIYQICRKVTFMPAVLDYGSDGWYWPFLLNLDTLDHWGLAGDSCVWGEMGAVKGEGVKWQLPLPQTDSLARQCSPPSCWWWDQSTPHVQLLPERKVKKNHVYNITISITY